MEKTSVISRGLFDFGHDLYERSHTGARTNVNLDSRLSQQVAFTWSGRLSISKVCYVLSADLVS